LIKVLSAALGPMMLLGGVASAQETVAPVAAAPADDRVVYEADFFSQYAPTNALDMVRRVPGFSIDGGDDRRGFAGAAGNVLIDGARPSAKSQDIGDILSRIPAAQVLRLELIRAASSGEASGQSVIVNVVRSAAAAGGSGTYEVELERSVSNRVEVRGDASYTGRLGAAEYTIGASRFIEERPLRGFRYLRDGDNSLVGSRADFTPRTYREAGGNAQISSPLLGGTLNLNLSAERWNFATDLESLGFTPAEQLTDSFRLSINERERKREIGGDFERKLGDWTLKAVGLDTRRWYSNDEQTLFRDANFIATDLLAQQTRNQSGETIARLTAAWPINDAHRIEFGGETAFNTLDARLQLTSNGVPIVLPAANVTVEEDRQEGFLTWTWKPAAKWSIESGVTVETSTISQSGDTSASRTLTYWKPTFQVSRQFGARDQARVKIFRDVSQLDFGDFASSATLADDTVAAGNPDLRPQTKWRLEGVLDKRFGEKAALSLTLAHEWVEDASALIPIFGGLLESYFSWVDTEVTDPTTFEKRPVSGNSDFYYEISFRQDLPGLKLAWGVEFEKASEVRQYRVAERETYEEGPFMDAFIETTRFAGAKVSLYASNLLDSEFRRERRFFAPNRAGAFVGEEERERQFGRFVGIEVSGNF
jgi:hypothetical protein